jgi:hypothetical protein
MTLGIISITLWVITILGFVFRNLWVRIQKLEEIVNNQNAFINNTKSAVSQVTEIFDHVDQENVFRSNDYVGQMWLELKQLNETLKKYKI